MGVTIAIDCMGGDHGPVVTVPAALEFLRSHPRPRDPRRRGGGDRAPARQRATGLSARIGCSARGLRGRGHGRSARVAMRNKKDSSMRVAVDLVKAGEARRCLGGQYRRGMAISRFVLKTLPGSIAPRSPRDATDEGHTFMCSTRRQRRLQRRASAPVRRDGRDARAAIEHRTVQRSACSTIGEEVIRANDVVKAKRGAAGNSGTSTSMGNVEGNDILKAPWMWSSATVCRQRRSKTSRVWRRWSAPSWGC